MRPFAAFQGAGAAIWIYLRGGEAMLFIERSLCRNLLLFSSASVSPFLCLWLKVAASMINNRLLCCASCYNFAFLALRRLFLERNERFPLFTIRFILHECLLLYNLFLQIKVKWKESCQENVCDVKREKQLIQHIASIYSFYTYIYK